MNIKITERQRKIILQALTDFEFEIKKSVCKKEICNDNKTAEQYQKYADEVHSALMLFK